MDFWCEIIPSRVTQFIRNFFEAEKQNRQIFSLSECVAAAVQTTWCWHKQGAQSFFTISSTIIYQHSSWSTSLRQLFKTHWIQIRIYSSYQACLIFVKFIFQGHSAGSQMDTYLAGIVLEKFFPELCHFLKLWWLIIGTFYISGSFGPVTSGFVLEN